MLYVNGSASSLPFGECVLSVFRRVVDSRAAVRREAEVASKEECDGGVILPPSLIA